MKNEENAGQTPSESQPLGPLLCSPGLEPLIQALRQQTEAITRLAMSNEALVAAMAEEDPDMLELPVRQYMDGSPIR